MFANKMFEAKAKLFTKENNTKPKQYNDSGGMEKLNKYFMDGQTEQEQSFERPRKVNRNCHVCVVLVMLPFWSPWQRRLSGID